jgi:flavin-dependent thymidylate synthase
MDNKIELLGFYGGDKRIAASAWTSTNRDMTPAKIERIPNLLKMLREGNHGQPHGTPFEKSMIHFLVTTDVATHIHILKHRIGVPVNGESARYKELKDDKYYIPDDWPEEWRLKLQVTALNCFEMYHDCVDSLVNVYGFSRKRAKESARYFNPYATQLTADVAFNMRSFVHFCGLRAVDGAQIEVQQLAKDMIVLIDGIRVPYDETDMDSALAPDISPFHHSLRVWGLTDLV